MHKRRLPTVATREPCTSVDSLQEPTGANDALQEPTRTLHKRRQPLQPLPSQQEPITSQHTLTRAIGATGNLAGAYYTKKRERVGHELNKNYLTLPPYGSTMSLPCFMAQSAYLSGLNDLFLSIYHIWLLFSTSFLRVQTHLFNMKMKTC